jgi:putative exosortase-associated protein (TIGR04073 family)
MWPMKRASFFLMIVFLFSFSASAYAVNEVESPGTPGRKIQRGFTNIVLFPLDIAAELSKERNTDHAIPSWATAIGRGSCYGVGRVLVGAYEMVTFFIPAPKNYEPILYPEFLWEHFKDNKTT